MSRGRRPLCGECPFARAGDEREFLKARVDHGCWVPCRHTVAPLAPLTHHDRIAAWAREEECPGARAWRRDRTLPTGAAQ